MENEVALYEAMGLKISCLSKRFPRTLNKASHAHTATWMRGGGSRLPQIEANYIASFFISNFFVLASLRKWYPS